MGTHRQRHRNGATSSAFLLTQSQLDHTVTVQASFTDDAGYAETVTSNATTTAVRPPNVSPNGQPTISGAIAVGKTLTADTSSITDDNGLTGATFTHQWVKNTGGADADITDATGSTYTITASDAGSSFKVTVAFTDDDGYAETVASNSTGPVAEQNNSKRQSRAIGPRTDVTLVSNIGVTQIDTGTLSAFDHAQQFTTGTSSRGYTLRSVAFVIGGTTPNFANITASINQTNADDEPGTRLGTLGRPSISGGVYTFSTSGIDLDASTSYFVMLDVTGTTTGVLSNASSGNQTSSYDWTIADGSVYRDKDTSGSWTDYGNLKRIRIIGADHGDITADATLSALELDDEDGNTIALNPTFVSSTKNYKAWVANSVESATLTATPSNTNATVVITDDDTATTTEADFDLDEGVNTLETTATSEDDNNTETYTITVVRAASEPTADPDAIWTANLTVGVGTNAQGHPLTGYHYNSLRDSWGAIAPATFDVDSKTIGVTTLQYNNAGTLRFDFDEIDTGAVLGDDNYVLHLGNKSFDITAPGTTDSLTFMVAGLTWTYGQIVPVKLVMAPHPATGSAGIWGTAQVGRTLTADTAGIADEDGLTTPGYTYRWTHVDADGSSNATNIGTNSSTYTLVADDAGKKVKLKVTFTDDASNSETLTSEAHPSGASTVAADARLVPHDWDLVPTGLTGDSFRLIFLTSTSNNLDSESISDYNTVVQERAAAGHTAIQDYSGIFKVVGSTADVDARDNTATTYTSSDKGVPIYWLNGDLVAADYEDFYDGSWDEEAANKNESGNNGLNTTVNTNNPATGSDHDGTESFNGSTSRALGSTAVRVGRPNSTDSAHGPISSDETVDGTRPLYALSDVLTVAGYVNTLPTGLPTIGGTLQVGNQLTADTSGITDADGLNNVDYKYQWIHVDSDGSSNPMNIGTDSINYTLLATDAGKRIKLKVDFTDDLDNDETLTSAATLSITGNDIQPVTVSFENASYTVAEGSTVSVKVRLSTDPEGYVAIPLSKTDLGGADSADYSGVPDGLDFASGDTEKSFTFTALRDDIVDTGESVRLSFGTLPTGVSAGTLAEAVVSIEDDTSTRTTTLQRIHADGQLNESTTVAGEFFMRILFNPSATGLTEEDLEITNATIDRFEASTRTFNGVVINIWYVDILPDDGVTTVTVRVPADVVDGGDRPKEVTYDADPPLTVTLTSSANEPVIDDFQVTATFSFGVTDISQTGTEEGDVSWVFIPADDLDIRRGAYVRHRFNFDGTVWTITVNPTASSPGTTVIYLPQGEVATGANTGVWNNAASMGIKSGRRSASFAQPGYAVGEGGDAIIKVVLDADPLNTVVIPLTATAQDGATTGDYSGIPATLTFNTGETEQTFTLSATDDFIDDDGESVKIAIGTPLPDIIQNGATAETSASITDNDTADLALNRTSLTVSEAGTGDFTVKLATQPTANVTVSVISGNTAAATVSDSSLTFSTSNWDAAQTVTVSGVDDADADNETATVSISSTSTDGNYEGKTGSVTVTVTDDETANLVVNPTTLTVGEAGTGDFTVKLSTQPTANVTVPVISGNTAAATVSDSSLTFSTSTWNTAQTVTVSGVHDDNSGHETVTVSLSAISTDAEYASKTGSVTVTLADNTATGDPIITGTAQVGWTLTADR